MQNGQVLLPDLSSMGKIGLIIKRKRNLVLKIQGFFLAILAFASGSRVKLEKPELVDEELGRFFVTTNDAGSFLALNGTLLTVGVLLLSVVLIGFLVVTQSGLLGSNQYSRYGNEYPHPHEHAYYGEQEDTETRFKRFAPNGNVMFNFLTGVKVSEHLFHLAQPRFSAMARILHF